MRVTPRPCSRAAGDGRDPSRTARRAAGVANKTSKPRCRGPCRSPAAPPSAPRDHHGGGCRGCDGSAGALHGPCSTTPGRPRTVEDGGMGGVEPLGARGARSSRGVGSRAPLGSPPLASRPHAGPHRPRGRGAGRRLWRTAGRPTPNRRSTAACNRRGRHSLMLGRSHEERLCRCVWTSSALAGGPLDAPPGAAPWLRRLAPPPPRQHRTNNQSRKGG